VINLISRKGTTEGPRWLGDFAAGYPAQVRGAVGATGVQGPMASGGSWSLYRDYTFDANSAEIMRADVNKAREVADYSRQNPSYLVGIDGNSKRRVNSVRDALIAAGVPADRIQAGAFGDPQLRGEQRVAVLVSN
jgi:outer membrane protein OmpA-like peptidoglycan-associated protein